MPVLAEILDVFPDLSQVPRQFAMRADWKSPPIHRVICVGEPIGRKAFQDTYPVADEAQIPRGGDFRVLLSQRTSCRVTGISEGCLSAQDERFVESGEVGHRKVHLAAYLERFRNIRAR